MTQFEIIMQTDKPELPAEIGNFEEVKAAISAALEQYDTDTAVTAETVKDAEKTRAHLRKVKEQIEVYRKDAKAAYLAKFETLEAQCKELSGLIEKPITAIDTKIKAFENYENEKKRTELTLFFASLNPPAWLRLEDVVNPKWKNKTATLDKLKGEITGGINGYTAEFSDLESMYGGSDLWTAISNRYFETKSKSQALVYAAQLERQRSEEQKRAEAIQKARAERAAAAARAQNAQQAISAQEAPHAATIPNEPENATQRTTASDTAMISGMFRVTGTREQIKALAAFLKGNGIRYEVIKGGN